METSRRRLPHVYPEGRWLFVTWHLYGSLPLGRYPPPGKLKGGKAFVWMDHHLDEARTGPRYLWNPEIAEIVVNCLRRGVEVGHYELGAYVVMANHVHVLVLPKVSPSFRLRAIKGVMARDANRVLGRTGQTFWQRESYDHWVRDEREWDRIARYIEGNPVKAGLVEKIEDYRWSSASAGMSPGAARTSACSTSPIEF